MQTIRTYCLVLFSLTLLANCQIPVTQPPSEKTDNAARPTIKEAQQFLADAEKRIAEVGEESARAAWIASNFINFDSQYLDALAGKRFTLLAVELASKARHYDELKLPMDERRKLDFLKLAVNFPSPPDPKLAAELSEISSNLQAMYGAGKYCPDPNKPESCLNLLQMSETLATSRDPAKMKEAWQGWRTISPPMREKYQRLVEIANAGAQALGYKELGAMWRAGYDMSPDEFATDVDKQWDRVKPLYEALHCHVRAKLSKQYGEEVVSPTGKIPAHLLGNMWAQSWDNLYDMVAPENTGTGVDITALIEKKKMTELDMVRTAEAFFTSLGFAPLPETFWDRSLFLKPRDRDVVCHASAWNMDSKDDLRIKMCIQKNGEDFRTIHHELGHNFYQRAYKEQPVLFQGSANDGFHEAVGDTISLSVTPEYLVAIGMLDKAPDAKDDVGLLMQTALEKIAFLPFGLLVDKWRWQVLSGETSPADYNQAWWQLREKYQGIQAPVARSEQDFDPGAKYHIPGNTPYTRYFLAHIQQFQFHRALCDAAGYKGPLHRCSIYNNKEAGAKLKAMLEMGSSQPWQEAMAAITGQRELDASAILDYFAPLKTWLDEQNAGRQCGWDS
ncbi:MAG: M2 family metallopeptidase [Pseudomonadota bacterium]